MSQIRPLFLGVMEERKGTIGIVPPQGGFIDLNGNSDIARRFREDFTTAQKSDIGRKVYLSRGIIRMESLDQMRARNAPEIHYGLTYEETRASYGGKWIDPDDFRALPAKGALCRSGDGHAVVSRDWQAVTWPACLAKKKED